MSFTIISPAMYYVSAEAETDNLQSMKRPQNQMQTKREQINTNHFTTLPSEEMKHRPVFSYVINILP